jgi:hypothetical protein
MLVAGHRITNLTTRLHGVKGGAHRNRPGSGGGARHRTESSQVPVPVSSSGASATENAYDPPHKAIMSVPSRRSSGDGRENAPGSHRDHARRVCGTGTTKTAHTRGVIGWANTTVRIAPTRAVKRL